MKTRFIIMFLMVSLSGNLFAQNKNAEIPAGKLTSKLTASIGTKGGAVETKQTGPIQSTNHEKFLQEVKQLCHQQNEKLICRNGSITNIEYMGDVALYNMTITKNLNIIGNVTATDSHLNEVNVMGDFVAKNTTVLKTIAVHGNAKLTSTIFHDSAYISGNIEANHTQFTALSKTPIRS